MAREYFHSYHSYRKAIEPLTDAEAGRLWRALLEYSETGIEQELRGSERYVYPLIKSQIDRDNENYIKKCEKNRINGSAGGQASATERYRTPPNAPQGKGKGKGKDKGEEAPLCPAEPNVVHQIIDHLNLRAGTKYKPSSESTKTKINTRLKEGYTLNDFIAVIDKKCDEWLGTEQEKFLRPETLFGSKFEGYTNQRIVKAQSQKPQSKFVNYTQRTNWNFDEMERLEREYVDRELQNCEGADD